MNDKHTAAQPLSEIETNDRRVLPIKYQALYNRLLRSNPARAKHLWETASYRPLTDSERKAKAKAKLREEHIRKASEALARVQQPTKLKRRV